MKSGSTGRPGTIARRLLVPIIIFVGFIGTMLGHNLILSGTVNPVDGTTITDSAVTLSGTFANSGCGLGGTITVTPDSGDITSFTKSCDDGIWSWSAEWSGYSEGWQTVVINFQSGRHGGPNNFVHTGTVTADYYIETYCDAPAAPAIANAYLRSLGYTNRNEINHIIEEVAHAMNARLFGENACSENYAEAVRDFVDALLD
jgi:hypothetical protein